MKELIQYFENIDKQLKIRKSIYIQEDHYIGTEKTWIIISEMNKESQCIVGMDIFNQKKI